MFYLLKFVLINNNNGINIKRFGNTFPHLFRLKMIRFLSSIERICNKVCFIFFEYINVLTKEEAISFNLKKINIINDLQNCTEFHEKFEFLLNVRIDISF